MLSEADDSTDVIELNLIEKYLAKSFDLNNDIVKNIIKESNLIVQDSIDIFDVAKSIDNNMNFTEKCKIIRCMYELSYADGDFHYLERNLIDRVGNIFNIDRSTLVKIKKEFLGL